MILPQIYCIYQINAVMGSIGDFFYKDIKLFTDLKFFMVV